MDDPLVLALSCAGAFVLQTVAVQAGNTRFFGKFKPGSGWYTNVEMSERYASLVTPANYAFAIWGIIYMWETLAVLCLVAAALGSATLAPLLLAWQATWKFWIAANVFQGVWAFLFAKEHIRLAACALSAISLSLLGLNSFAGAGGSLAYWLLSAPVWLHAGWTAAASLVGWNLLVVRCDAASQFVAAMGSFLTALTAGFLFYASSGPAALPGGLALAWALAAIAAKIRAPGADTACAALAEVGEEGRNQLEIAAMAAAMGLVFTGVVTTLGAVFNFEVWRR